MSGEAVTSRNATAGVIPPISSRVTVKDSVYRTLRDLILDGVLTPGARLIEAELGRQLGTSSTPIREALLTLAAEGLVSLSPHQGAHVSRLSYAEIEERLFMRDALEAAAIARVVRNIGESQLAVARRHVDEMRSAIAKLGSALALGTPEAFGRFVAAQTAKWADVAAKANIRVD